MKKSKLTHYKELVTEIQNKFVVVFGGFSGFDYQDREGLKIQMKKDLENYIVEYGANNLAIVCGATPDGVGVIYEVAKGLNLNTYGIVSSTALNRGDNPQSPFCDITLFVEQPKDVWTVKNKEGLSLMVDIATKGKGGLLHYYNGGLVSLEELQEAKYRNIPYVVNMDYKPNQNNVEIKKQNAINNGVEFIAEPLLNFIQ